jgi:hypothetical protein
MRMRLAMKLVAVTGCTWGGPPAPIVVGVSPASGVAGKEEILSVTVSALDPAAGVDFDATDQSPVCDYFRVELTSALGVVTELRDVVRVSPTELRGRLTRDTDRSLSFDVTVIDPNGLSGTLAEAFRLEKCLDALGGPSGPCDDGNSCTTGDTCNGVDRCSPGTPIADGVSCEFACTRGDAPVDGRCVSGGCVPDPGSCPAAPAPCSAP